MELISSFPDTYINMKKLLSLPPNLVNSFHRITKTDVDEWFCTSDPVGARLGSGGGTTWLIEACWQKEASSLPVKEWLAKDIATCRRAEPAFTGVCSFRKNIDTNSCLSVGEGAEVITKSIVFAASPL